MARVPIGTEPWGEALNADLNSIEAEIQGHVDQTSDAHNASAISFDPGGSVTATNVQDAITQAAEANGGVAFFTPEQFGAVGDGIADDTTALQDAEDAAHDAGGGIVFLTQRYGWTGDLLHRGGVTLMGVGNARFTVTPGSIDDIENGLVAIGATARLLVGSTATGNSQDDNPGPIQNLLINGRGIGGTNGSLIELCNGADARFDSVTMIHSAGKLLECKGHQNFTFDKCLIGYSPDGTAISMLNTGQGVGNGKFNNCYIATSEKLVYAGATAGQFQPHDVFFNQCLFENYDGSSTNDLIHLTAGEFQFSRCVFTNSTSAVPSHDAVVLIEQIAYPSIATMATFESCYFNGGSTGVTDLIRSKGATGNHVRIYGRTHVSNGDNIICADGGPSDVAIEGSIFRNAGTLNWFRAVNGGNLTGVRRRTSQPMRFEMPDDATGTLPNPVSFRRLTDTADRGRIDRDFVLRWLDGADGGTTQGSLSWDAASGAMIAGGMWQIQNALVRRPLLVNVTSVGQAVTISAAKTALTTYYLSMSAGNSATLTMDGGIDGSQIRIAISSTSGNSITWPSNVFFHITAPQPIAGKTQYVDLEKLGPNWFEVSRTQTTTGGSATTIPANVQTANYTLALSDAGKIVEMNSASGTTVTVPTNATVAIPVDTIVYVHQYGAGQVTIAPASGVTIRTPASFTTRAQYSTVMLRKRGTNEWVLSGDLT